MKNRKIISPMPLETGACIVHQILARRLKGYRVACYHPYLTLFPPLLPILVSLQNAQLIHTIPDYAVFFSRPPIPLVVTFHNYVLDRWMHAYSNRAQRIHYMTDLKLWTRMAVKRASSITAVSSFTANMVKRELNLSGPVQVIYNGVDSNHFTPPARQDTGKKEVRVFFSGNLTSRKGVQWLPAIAKRLQHNVRIYYTHGLRARSTLPNVPRLRSIGAVSFDEMPNRYRNMDILLLPTVREGFSLAVLEGMACSLPVVAGNCSSLPEQIDESKGGFLCPVGDVKAFADKINYLADSPKLRREMGEYNRAKVEKMFTLDRMVKEYQALFQEVLG